MATYQEQLKKATAKAYKWLGAEFSYFKELKKDLEQLKSDISEAKEKKESKDIKKALRDFRYIGRAERREARYEHKVEEALKGIKKEIQAGHLTGLNLEEIEKVIKDLEIASRNVLRNASMYEGHIKDELVEIQAAVKVNKTDIAQAKINKVEGKIDDMIGWLTSLSTDIKSAMRLQNKLHKAYLDKVLKDNIPLIDSFPNEKDYQENWIQKYKQRNIKFASAADIYKAFPDIDAETLAKAREYLQQYLVTSTRIIYKGENAVIIHNYKGKETKINVEVPYYYHVSMSKVLSENKGIKFVQALFNTKDSPDAIIETLKALGGRSSLYLYTPDISSRGNYPERAVCLGDFNSEFLVGWEVNPDISYGFSFGVL